MAVIIDISKKMKKNGFLLFALTAALLLATSNVMAQDTVKRSGDDLLRFGGNLSFMTSKTYIYDGYRGMNGYSWRPGVSFQAEYEHVWPSGWGIGTTLDYNHTVYDGNMYKSSYAFNLFYWGVGGVYHLPLGQHWKLNFNLGLGWAHVGGDADEESSGVGLMQKVGAEYRLSPLVGLNLQLAGIASSFPEPDTFKELQRRSPGEVEGSYGFHRLELSAGITVHL